MSRMSTLLCKVFNLPIYYDSIDNLPIHNWFMIHQKNDDSYLIISGNKKFARTKTLRHNLDKIFCEYIDSFGISAEFKQILKLKANIAVLKYKEYCLDDKGATTLREVAEIELEALLNKSMNSKKIKSATPAISKFFGGMQVDEYKMTVRQYYTYLETLKEEIEKDERFEQANRR